MLQLHDFIQNMPYEPKFFPMKKMLTEFAESGDGAAFDFGDTDKLEDEVCENLARYACELAKHKMLKLPYNPVYYSWNFGNKVFGAFIIQEEDDHDYDSFRVVFMFGDKKPFRYAGIGTLGINDLGKAAITDDVVPIDLQGTIIHLARGAHFPNNDAEESLYRAVCYYVVVLTALMESPHTKTRVTSVGEKLNLKRAKRGVPQIMPFHTVYFEVDGKEYNTDGSGIGNGSQKRLHWRRGHVRHLSSGKITHVRPCLVGALGTEAHVAKPMYSMKQKGSAA